MATYLIELMFDVLLDETEEAYRLAFGEESAWLPKSMVVITRWPETRVPGTVEVPAWLVEKRELEEYAL